MLIAQRPASVSTQASMPLTSTTRLEGGRIAASSKAKEFVEKVDEIWNLVRDEAIKAQ